MLITPENDWKVVKVRTDGDFMIAFSDWTESTPRQHRDAARELAQRVIRRMTFPLRHDQLERGMKWMQEEWDRYVVNELLKGGSDEQN